jgi:hypothetical protein
MKKWAFIFLFIFILGFIGYGYLTFLEPTPPTGEWLNHSEALGTKAVLTISASDRGQGLGRIEVLCRSGEKDFPLYFEDFSDREPALEETTFEFPIDLKENWG